MRRNDREITDSREILSIVNECKVIRLAMLDEQGLPYIIPLNFGYRFADGVFTFYCHSAREGRKLELLRRDPRVSFEMDCRGELQSADHACAGARRSISDIRAHWLISMPAGHGIQ